MLQPQRHLHCLTLHHFCLTHDLGWKCKVKALTLQAMNIVASCNLLKGPGHEDTLVVTRLIHINSLLQVIG